MLDTMLANGELEHIITETLCSNINELKSMIVDIRDYGTFGNGIYDDTLAIQTAIDETAGTKAIYLPAGTYLIESLRLKPNTKLIGESKFTTILKANKNSNAAMIYGEDLDFQHSEISNITIDGNKENQSSEVDGLRLEMKNIKSYEIVNNYQDLIIQNCSGSGLVLNGKAGNNLFVQMRLKNIFSHNNEGYGYVLNHVSDSYIDTCECCQNKKGGFVGVLYSTKIVSCKAWFNGYEKNGSGFDFEKCTRVTMVACEGQDNWGHGIKFKDSTFIDLNVDVDNNGILATKDYERIKRENVACKFSGVYFENVTRANVNITADNFMYSFFGYMQKTALEIIGGGVITGVVRTRNQEQKPIFNEVDFSACEFIIDGSIYDKTEHYNLNQIEMNTGYSLVTTNDMNKLTKKRNHVHLQAILQVENITGTEMKTLFKLPKDVRPNNPISYCCMLGSSAYNFQELGNLLISLNGDVSVRDIKETGLKFVSICLDYDIN